MLNAEPPAVHVVRATHRVSGRVALVGPEAAAIRLLRCSRTRLEAHAPPVAVEPGDAETALVCLDGSGVVRVGTERFRMTPFDALYVPRDVHFMIAGGPAGIDVVEAAAPVEAPYPLQFVTGPYDQRQDPAAGGGHWRHRTLIGPPAGRLAVGISTGWGPGPMLPPLPPIGADVVCLCLATGCAESLRAHGDGAVTTLRAGDAMVGVPSCEPADATAGQPVVMLWMLGAHDELAGRQPRPFSMIERSARR